MSEFDRAPVPPAGLKPGRHFAAGFAGEHIAGTEFVIGAMFVAWGVGAMDVIKGLVLGNLLAVLTWALICTPIATNTRLTLYAYLEKIAGPGFMKIYSVINGILFCVLAGAMITVSASAVRILFDIPPQVEWYPTDFRFVLVAMGVGAVVTVAATKGFTFIARFAEISAPWLITMFFVGALATLPVIVSASTAVSSIGALSDFVVLAETDIWVDRGTEMNFWHVVAIAWGANLAFHGALGDMTLLRFARRTWYGWYSTIGMFIGHFAAWLAAGIMGAGAAVLLTTDITSLDAGAVAYQALGAVGIFAVIIAGWTTSNPTIYRAGLAFQSLNPRWSRETVTVVVGSATTLIAVFPFVFTGLLNFLGLMALLMAPTGGIIVAEHYLLKRLGGVRYWRAVNGSTTNIPALMTWGIGLAVAFAFSQFAEIHILFLFIPAWMTAFLIYPVLALSLGARAAGRERAAAMETAERERREAEAHWLAQSAAARDTGTPVAERVALFLSVFSLAVLLGVGVYAYVTGELALAQNWLIWPTVFYFAVATSILVLGARPTDKAART